MQPIRDEPTQNIRLNTAPVLNSNFNQHCFNFLGTACREYGDATQSGFSRIDMRTEIDSMTKYVSLNRHATWK